MNESRFIKYDRRTLYKRKRTVPIWGADEDTGKYYKCWNCGFRCNSSRDKSRDSVGYVAKDYARINTLTDYIRGTDSKSLRLCLDTIDTTHHLMELDAESNPVTISRNFSQTVSGECPFCGCKNWK